MKLLVLVFANLTLLGCMTVDYSNVFSDGEVSETISKFDGSKEITASVAHLEDFKIKMGAYRNTKMKPEEAILIVEIRGAANIETKDALQINLDGKIHKLTAIDEKTDIHSGSLSAKTSADYSNFSSKRFPATRSLLSAIVSAQKAIFKLSLQSGEYVEDSLGKPPGHEKVKFAQEGLKEFLAKAF